MLQHARPGQGAFLGHVTDQENGRTALFGITHQQGRTFAHLRDTARGRLQLLGEDGLDRVDNHHLGLFRPGSSNDVLNAGFGHDPQLVLR